ncbi:MAG TPA: hypothetical protein VFS60_17400 [Thermoanaerobaculia bacterium]|nr:hypothetical protein [Thermoanaerobaculia bacterium]
MIMANQDTQELNRFAKALMRLVRDPAIEGADLLISARMEGPDGERWRHLVTSDDVHRALIALIPEVVDQTLFELLNAVDNGELPIEWRASDGSPTSLRDLGLGEMAGWLMASPGWRHEYSSQRFFDPFADLKLDLGRKADDEMT